VAKRKKINFRLIDRITGAEPYGILDRMREHHATRRAFWNLRWSVWQTARPRGLATEAKKTPSIETRALAPAPPERKGRAVN
jgi:hypothetical protein